MFQWPLFPFHGGPNDLAFSVRLKPAETVIGKEYRGEGFDIAFKADGDVSEWTAEYIQIEDQLNDSNVDSLDLFRVYIFDDSVFIYLRVELEGNLRDTDVIGFSIDYEGDSNPDNEFSFWYDTWRWVGNFTDFNNNICSIDVIAASASEFEIQVARLLLPDISSFDLQVFVVNNVTKELIDKSESVTYYLQVSTTSVHTTNPNLPESFHLHPNYPNPFNPETVIRYELPEATDVQLRIYNLRGQEVRTLVSGVQPPGAHVAAWDGRDKQGAPVASGIYLYRLATKQFVKSRKMLLLR